MAKFSRRQFLQLAGITLLAGALPTLETLAQGAPSGPGFTAPLGRTLMSATLHAQPSAAAAVIGRLWPDSIIPIASARPGWYRAGDGFVARSTVQPVMPIRPPEPATTPEPPFWAEVSGPAAAVRQWCAADAPLVARIGHGGTAQVIRRLPPGSPGASPWYALAATDGSLLGWTQTAHWQPVRLAENDSALHLELTRSDRQLTVFAGTRPVLRAAAAAGAPLQPGAYPLHRASVAGPPLALVEYDHHALYGAPWQLDLGGRYRLTGAYWHNRFGGDAPGPDIQVPPFLARWLYAQAGTGSVINIR